MKTKELKELLHQAYSALKVIVLTPAIHEFLEANDTQALKQAIEAINAINTEFPE